MWRRKSVFHQSQWLLPTGVLCVIWILILESTDGESIWLMKDAKTTPENEVACVKAT